MNSWLFIDVLTMRTTKMGMLSKCCLSRV